MEFKCDFSNIENFEKTCRDVGAELDIATDTSILAQPVNVSGRTIPNSLAIHPMEGCDGEQDGSPGELTRRRYGRFADGGAGLLWVEAIAVRPEGRANPRQLWIHAGNREHFAAMVRDIRRRAADSMGSSHRPLLVAQLTHSGRYSRPAGVPAPYIPQRDPYRDPLLPEPRPTSERASGLGDNCTIVSDDYLDELQDEYVDAARLAMEAGFDAVDIKACHGYLVGELLASRDRPGKYGGGFENRTRFLTEVVAKISDRLGDECMVTSRLGFYDAVPYPFGWGVDEQDYAVPDLSEPKRLVKQLMDCGVAMLNLTVANPYYNPHVGRPFIKPVENGYSEPEHPLKGVERLLKIAAGVQMDFPALALVGTGYSYLREYMGNVGAGVKSAGKATLIGGGRMAFAYPDFPKDLIENGAMDRRKVCTACSACTQLMRYGQPTGCVVRDRDVYRPLYDAGRRAAAEVETCYRGGE